MKYILKALAGFFLDIVETVVIALSVFLVIYLFFMQPHQVNGQSMLPTFKDKEYLLTDKVSYKLALPERGDMIVFHAPDGAGCPPGGSCDFIKRIIAIEGDSIEIIDGLVYVNDSPLNETYLDTDTYTRPAAYINNRRVVLGPDEYFVMGDNRDHSSDSRAWGPIRSGDIVGKVFFRYWPIDQAGRVEHASLAY